MDKLPLPKKLSGESTKNNSAESCVTLYNSRMKQSLSEDNGGHTRIVERMLNRSSSAKNRMKVVIGTNIYEGDVCDEPTFQFVEENGKEGSKGATPTSPSSSPKELKESMAALKERLASGALLSGFEGLYRRAPGLSMEAARLAANEARNRYRDISPYDATRVLLTPWLADGVPASRDEPHNDYINASHVAMSIAGATNRYIASQGPLSHTAGHFWQMVWQQGSALVVMLTTVVEQGRSKCHQYWPATGATQTHCHGALAVKCGAETRRDGYTVRALTLTVGAESRRVTQLQYTAWPDHGVPHSPDHFLAFVREVRALRTGPAAEAPTVVHCSAGIGRTGVLILMESAQCLIEADLPVRALSLVAAMRDQRAMMIQTTGQFKFVCEAIDRVYSEGLVKPLKHR